jgi:ABC-type long-subunit fatty acid transport system fused permease/ATPase subunit
MFREFFCDGTRRRRALAWFGLLSIVAHALFRARVRALLNQWYGEFYDLLGTPAEGDGSAHDAARARQVRARLREVAALLAPGVLVTPLVRWIGNVWGLSWRLALVRAYLSHYDLDAKMCVENASQRMHEDTQRFERGVRACARTVLDSACTLAVFVPVLWSAGAPVHVAGVRWQGGLLAVAVGASALGCVVSACVGAPLVRLEIDNQRVEGALRTQLVLLEHGKDADADAATPAVPRGPSSNVARFGRVLDELRGNYRALYRRLATFDAWIALYDQTMILLPLALVAPLVFEARADDRIALGTVVRVVHAFADVFGALSVVANEWASINDFRSTVARLREFERATYAHRAYDGARLVDEDG